MSALAISTEPPVGTDCPSFDEWEAERMVAACLIKSPAYAIPGDQRYGEHAALIAAVRNALPELIRLATIGLKAKTERGKL